LWCGTEDALEGSIVPASRGELCPSPGVRRAGGSSPPSTETYVAFTSDDGSIAKMAVVRQTPPARVRGRYEVGEVIASGGVATVHLGRLVGSAGFSRTVAIKRLHAYLSAERTDLHDRFVDEAQIASRVRHANVVPTLDVVVEDEELLLVLDYVHGESLARLRRAARAMGEEIPPDVASAIVIGALRGLDAAHEATSTDGKPLEIVHRDVSPQNILVGVDGVARVCDFGIAKAASRIHETFTHDIKGKVAYMAPEQLSGENVDRRCDLFAAGVILWEAFASRRLFREDDALATMDAIFHREVPPLAGTAPGIDEAVDEVLARALAKDASARFESAAEMARALEHALPPSSDREVAEWVQRVAGDVLAKRAQQVAAFERRGSAPPPAHDSDTYVAPPPAPESHVRSVSSTDESDAAALASRADSATSPAVDASDEPETGTVSRRDAVAPPPLGALEEAVTFSSTGRLARKNEPAFRPAIASETETEACAVPTPFSMVAPVVAHPPSSGATRVAPIREHHRTNERARVWTPIPMPPAFPIPASPKLSVARIAALVLAPPVFAAIAVLAVSSARAPEAAAAGAPPAEIAPPPALVELPPPAVTVTGSATNAAPPPTAAPTAPPASARPDVHRPPFRQPWRPRRSH
jgi:serine/threonine-protein kinase